MRSIATALVVTLALMGAASAQTEPPVQGPADAACRGEARAKVFTAPNPNNLSLWDLGSQIWHTCMAAYHASGPNPERRENRF